MKYVIQLDNQSWVADIDGDPGRTRLKSRAKQFRSKAAAKTALDDIKKEYPFRNYSMSEIQELEK
jgi:hypothetical protein